MERTFTRSSALERFFEGGWRAGMAVVVTHAV